MAVGHQGTAGANQDQVDGLKKLFAGRVGFECQVVRLTDRGRSTPHDQLMVAIGKLIEEHDGDPRSQLLLILNTGHGNCLSEDQTLTLCG